jgi:hypothetical protein
LWLYLKEKIMPFPMKKKPMFDNPADEKAGMPHAEPEGDESYIDDIMSQDINESPQGSDDVLGGSKLESALQDAGFNATPEQLAQIEQILAQPAKPEAKPSLPASGGKPTLGGAVPGGMNNSDIGGMGA